ncbi:MAG TPA: AbrB/MazE/SpoVT family DNA-binding domain-containing protein [Chloroflexota bacterium]|jgi:AbrB family looped-hinge helix DNA binding protein|nr:AbrB/MazE/SpoVT family DNA-binding domain-containing protein [Chloroflexota bacterium]
MIVPTKVGETTITGKNQISLPAEGVRMLGWKRGDRLSVRVMDENTIVLTRWPKGQSAVEYFAGKLAGVWGTPEEARRYLEEERASWGELGRDLGPAEP